MLFLLIGLMLIASVCVLCMKKNRESFLLLGMCFSLMIHISGMLIFIAKKGGFSQDIIRFLFFSLSLKNTIQYLYITLGQMGYIIALGRYLFPLFLLESSLQYSTLPFLLKHPCVKIWVAVLPVATLVVYYPPLFRSLTAAIPWLRLALVQVSYVWIIAYVCVALLLLVWEWHANTIRYYRRQFACIAIYLTALSGLFVLYCGQDPAQVYHFYSYPTSWLRGLGYLQIAPGMTGYVAIVIINVICCVFGMWSLLKYTRSNLLESREESGLERKFDVARTGASVFIHSIKNQLLANRVLEKHIYQELDSPEPDLSIIRTNLNQLHQNNELLLSRSEELYRTVKSKSVRLVPTPLNDVLSTTLTRFDHKYPDARRKADANDSITVLADINYLSEALYNLMINAWEANLEAGHTDVPILLLSRQERAFTILEVRDEGTGIDRRKYKHIFEPFYSSKNSNVSWGMGLFHARTIIKAHLGTLRAESAPGRGTSFFVLLPRYDKKGQVNKS